MKLKVEIDTSVTNIERLKKQLLQIRDSNEGRVSGFHMESEGNTKEICLEILQELKSLELDSYFYYTQHETAAVILHKDYIHLGRARRYPYDIHNTLIGRALAVARAMNWKDSEKKLLDSMDDPESLVTVYY